MRVADASCPHGESRPLVRAAQYLDRARCPGGGVSRSNAIGYAARREDGAEQRLDKLEAVLVQGTNDLSEAVPLLADLLSIPTGDRYPPLNLTPQKRKEKTLHAQLAQVEGLAARQPVLMVFEDIHWSDPTTRESLDLLIDRVPTMRVLVIITFRPEFTPPWVGRPHVILLSLNRLPPRQRAEMIARITGGKTLPREITDQIIDRTDGVPLFIEELTKSVVESGIITETGDSYAVTGPATPLAIPSTLHASLVARLDRLAPTREVAQIGAALGRSFSHELISAVAQMPQQKLDDALAQLVTAELVFRRGVPPDAEYTFKHALVQDAAYSTLLRSRRQQMHARIATVLENQFPDLVAAQPQMMAHHCAEAGLTDKAVGYRLTAGQQAVARSTKLDKLDAVLAQTSTSKQDAALFADMLSLPNDGRYPALDLAPEQRRQRTMEALIAQTEVTDAPMPVLMIFEDAHWTDPTSLELFGRAVDRIASLRVLLIVTFRPEFAPPWIGRPHVTALTVNRLAQRDIDAMIDGVVGNKLLAASIRQDIIERTDGIPLFVEEMTKAVLEAGSEDAAQWTAATIPSPTEASDTK